jgi:hypothetical protein
MNIERGQAISARFPHASCMRGKKRRSSSSRLIRLQGLEAQAHEISARNRESSHSDSASRRFAPSSEGALATLGELRREAFLGACPRINLLTHNDLWIPINT